MYVIHATNVNDAIIDGFHVLNESGHKRESRNGPVIQLSVPVCTVYSRPWERVLLHEWREANPFFHLYECLWMMAGRKDVAPLARYVSRMTEFTDDGKYLNAAYGWRWTRSRGNQITKIINILKSNSNDRRCVLQIWDAIYDLAVNTNDAACNLTATFQIARSGKLDMVVFCRSNDMIWGCYGANAVHFSFLHEYVARCVGVPQGTYTQISVNFHAYLSVFQPMFSKIQGSSAGYFKDHFPIISTNKDSWDNDVSIFVTQDGRATSNINFEDKFFTEVALPIVRAHDAYKDEKDFSKALQIISECKATDWKFACTQWLKLKLSRSLSNESR